MWRVDLTAEARFLMNTRFFAVLMLLTGVAGCSGLAARQADLQAPKVDLVGVKLLEMDPLAPRFRVRLKLDNPNDQTLNLDGADAVLTVLGEKLAKGVTQNAVSLPARGTAETDVDVSAKTLSFLKLLPQLQKSDALPYQVAGKLHFLQALGPLGALPFQAAGTVKTEELLGKLGAKFR
jgi:LEA14-like dessication related protein